MAYIRNSTVKKDRNRALKISARRMSSSLSNGNLFKTFEEL